MQCGNCQFQNMPGSAACGRCGSSLNLAAVSIDVHPPRAGAWRKGFRRAVPIQQLYHGAARAVTESRLQAALPFLGGVPQLFRSLVPGWAHFHAGLRWLGHLFLWGFLALFIPGMLHFGSGTGSILLGLAFSVHSTAVLDIVMRSFVEAGLRDRMVRSVAVTLVLAGVVYYPAGWVLTRLMEPHNIDRPFGSFQPGDVVMSNQWATVKPGKLVLYTPYDVQEETNRNGGHTHYYTIFTGPRIDRVLAKAGDVVQWDGRTLRVNGLPSALRPLDVSRAAVKLKLTVPVGNFFILPTGGVMVPLSDDTSAWLRLSVVPEQNIAGCIYARTQPFSRVSWFR